LEFKILKDAENQRDYTSKFEVLNVTESNMTIHINFSAPLNVSASSIKDLL